MVRKVVLAGDDSEGCLSVQLRPHNGRQLWAVVDHADYALVEQLGAWHIQEDQRGRMYPWTTMRRSKTGRLAVRMAEIILGPPPGQSLRMCYFNSNGLDNRRSNIGWATQLEIVARRRPEAGSLSPYKGVTFDKQRWTWKAQFRNVRIGRFLNEADAARAVDDVAFAEWGHRCYLNFPERYEGVQPGGDPHGGRQPIYWR